MKKNQFVVSCLIFILFAISLIIGFFYGEAISGAGAKKDFYFTWNYVLALENNFFVDPTPWTIHTPLHYLILLHLNKIFNSQEIVRFFMVIVSILVPILFYLNLKIKFPATKKNILIILAASIFIFPAYRYSALWANSHITAIIFFLLSTYFFLIWEKSSNKKIKLSILFSVIFLAASVYTRQYYALFFIYYLFIFYNKLHIKEFLKIIFFIFILSLPGVFLITEYPLLLKNNFFTFRYHNTFLIISSIICFYLIPFFLLYCISESKKLLNNKRFISNSISSLIITSACILVGFNYFDFNSGAGGGFFLKLSYFVFNNPYFFFLTSLFGFFMVIFLLNEDKENAIIIFLLFLGLSGYVIYQKLLEPLFLLIFFLLFKTNLTSNFLKNDKNMYLYFIYLMLYLVSAAFNEYFKISSKLVF